MTITTELAQRMRTAATRATKGEWWADEVENEGSYGSGDDCVEGFTSYAIYGSDGQTLFDSLNSDAACISEEYDGEGHVAWDETAQRNAEFIALANPANVLALLDAKDAKAARDAARISEMDVDLADRNGVIAEQAKENRKLRQRIAELEAQALRLETSCDRNYVAGLQAGWNFGDAGDNDGLAQCIESRQKYIREAQTEQQPVAYMHHSGQVITREECCDDEIFAICCKVEKPLYASAPAAQPVTVTLPDDTRRMDWLVSKAVNVREPQVYGSHSIFWAQKVSEDWAEVHATSLRDQIDSAMQSEQCIKIAEGE